MTRFVPLVLAVTVLACSSRAPVGTDPDVEGELPAAGEPAAPAAVAAAAPATGTEVLRAMHARYEDDWYRTLSFKQRVIRTAPDGSQPPTEVWTEYARVPGLLRIDLADGYNGNAVIYRGDSLYVFQQGRLVQAQPEQNELLILGFDVYGQPAAATARVLESRGFDLSKVRADTWQGRPVWVVGADAGDLHSRQFWIDRDRLLFVRMLQPLEQDTTRTLEFRFDDYERLGGGWIAPTVLFLVDGREVMREEYFDMVADPTLPDGIFDPESFGAP